MVRPLKLNEVELFHDIAMVLTESLDVRQTLESILHLLEIHARLKRGMIFIFDSQKRLLRVSVAHGISEAAKKRGVYQVGEGITGKVVETGQAIIVPDISLDTRFLNRTRTRASLRNKKRSFICVPIKMDKQVIGTLSADKDYDGKTALEGIVKVLNIVASFVAQVMRLHELVEKEKQELFDENIRLRQDLKERYQVEGIVGHSGAMNQVYALIHQVAPSNSTVLIHGESGTGKELVANAIHYSSPRATGPYIKMNCAAMPESLLESELFGHEKGAFTGATEQKIGRFELADGGTIFLDEIGEFSPALQVKLLRVLQGREFERVGGRITVKVNIRVIVATNKDLEKAIKSREFREDLYYRINVFPICLPPLREHKDDIILLAEHFLEKYSRENYKNIKRISTPAIDMLMSYHWPGNVRELENCIERAVLLCEEEVIRAQHWPPSLQTAEATATSYSKNDLIQYVNNIEREMIIEALKNVNGHQKKAAKKLNLTERMMGYKVRKHSIQPRLYHQKTV